MAEKKSPEPDTRKSFQDFLAACPAVDAPADRPGGRRHGSALGEGGQLRAAHRRRAPNTNCPWRRSRTSRCSVVARECGSPSSRLTPSASAPSWSPRSARCRRRGGLKSPLEKAPPFDKFPPGDKFPPFDKLPPLDKQPPFDTLKEPPLDKPPPSTSNPRSIRSRRSAEAATHSRSSPFDTLKELIEDTFKEVAKDPIGEGGGGTGIADTLRREFPGGGVPGGPVIQPQAAMRAAAPGVAKFPPQDKVPQFDTLKEIGGGDTLKEQPFDTLKEIGGGGDTLKEQPFDTLKELGGGDTLKEEPFDTLKELIEDTFKEVGKDPLGDGGGGTGIADTLVERPRRRFSWRSGDPAASGGGNARRRPRFGQVPGAGQAPDIRYAQGDLGGGDTLKEQPFDTLKETRWGRHAQGAAVRHAEGDWWRRHSEGAGRSTRSRRWARTRSATAAAAPASPTRLSKRRSREAGAPGRAAGVRRAGRRTLRARDAAPGAAGRAGAAVSRRADGARDARPLKQTCVASPTLCLLSLLFRRFCRKPWHPDLLGRRSVRSRSLQHTAGRSGQDTAASRRSRPGNRQGMILVISTPQDPHAQAVMTALTARGVTGHRILDLSEFPLRMDLGISMANGGEGQFALRLADGTRLRPSRRHRDLVAPASGLRPAGQL